MSDSAGTIGYAAAADAYWQAGWRGVLPLERGRKWPPPAIKEAGKTIVSYTGYTGIDPSYADILTWSENFRDGNLCLRLPDGVIGIDVDGYAPKTGAAALGVARSRWGPLPPAPRSTSRADLVSGIRLFRVPAGTILADTIAFPEFGIGDIEVIQRHHRYVVAWPSIHPEDRPYWWRNDDGQFIGIPPVDELPWLPQRWIDGLHVDRQSNLGNTPTDIRLVLTAGDPSVPVRARLSQAIKDLNLPGTSRHDTTCRHVLAIMRMGKSGQPGVKKALQLLCDVFIAATGVDHSRTPEQARAEFDRMITNDNAARELATPSSTDWMQALGTAPTNGSASSDGGAEEADHRGDSPAGDTESDASSAAQAAQYLREIHENLVREQAMKLRVRDEAQAMWNRQRAALMGQQPPVMVSMPEFLAVPDEDTIYRVGELFPVGARVLLTAQYKAGKTSIIANLLRSLVDGDPFLGRYPVESIERVLLVDTELDERTLRRWLRDQTIRNIEGINILSLRGRLSSFAITDDRNRAEWAARIAGAELIMLDCLRPCLDALGLSEDKEAGVFLTAFDALCRESGAGEAVVVHHMGHSMERSRGDSRLLDWPDALWKLVREQDDDGNTIEAGNRYFSAVGRDVNVGESLLDWQPETRALTVVGGNRVDRKAYDAIGDVVDILRNPQFAEGLSKNQLVTRLKAYGHGRNVARAAVDSAVFRAYIYAVDGPRGSALHRLNPSHGELEE